MSGPVPATDSARNKWFWRNISRTLSREHNPSRESPQVPINAETIKILGGKNSVSRGKRGKKRRMSASAKARIAKAQRARWASVDPRPAYYNPPHQPTRNKRGPTTSKSDVVSVDKSFERLRSGNGNR